MTLTEVTLDDRNYDVLHSGAEVVAVYHHNSGSVVPAWEQRREFFERAIREQKKR